jgi:methionyl-tRNA formyltransferase
MNVLILGKSPSPLSHIIRESGCKVIERVEPFDLEYLRTKAIDFAVSYGYRYLIKKPAIIYLKQQIVNLHISFLPWNRGADPNLWSFLEDTPKGVTIHYIDEGLDTGDIIAQKEMSFEVEYETLATTYTKLNAEIVKLFKQNWSSIMQACVQSRKQPISGSFHRLEDKKPFEYLLAEKRWNTPVKELIGKALLIGSKG